MGANIGHYTKLFAGLAGRGGRIFAFEPSPVNYRKLSVNLAGFKNVTLLPCGLGAKEETVTSKQGEDELGATSQAWNTDASLSSDHLVKLCRGDNLVSCGSIAPPNFIKVDVEGFELEVIIGLGDLLERQALRAIGIEVHFGLLARRGMEQAPQQIEELLRKAGFACVWSDSSHVLATRSEK